MRMLSRRFSFITGLIILTGCGQSNPTTQVRVQPEPAPATPSVAPVPVIQKVPTVVRQEKLDHIDAAPKNVVQQHTDWSAIPLGDNVQKGTKWLVSVQGEDGGWGQDGGEDSFVRKEVKLESSGNDVANTCVATLALIRAGSTPTNGEYSKNVNKAAQFVLERVEASPTEGLAINTKQGTQIQRKLGPNIDTFMASMLLAEIDGNMGNARDNERVRKALNKVVAKIEKNQSKDGTWNTAGGWAPILGTSYCSRSLQVAQSKGAAVNQKTLDKIQDWSKDNADQELAIVEHKWSAHADASESLGMSIEKSDGTVSYGRRSAGGRVDGDAGVKLYKYSQTVEQLSRSQASRSENKASLELMTKELTKDETIRGFGSMGGEEFFSYLNTSDSLCRVRGEPWEKWNTKIKAHIMNLQNQDGTWAGQHCITGRVACTGAAVLTLLAERTPAEVRVSEVK